MPRVAKLLSARAVASLSKQEGYHTVGGVQGLYLQVRGGGASWVLRATVNGKRRDIGLGSYRDLSLERARECASEHRALIVSGLDPVQAREQKREAARLAAANRISFSECAERCIESKRSGWRNVKHAAQWTATLATYAHPLIGNLPVAEVTTTHVLQVVEPIWHEKHETATRLRGRIEEVLDWASARGYRAGENPARWRGHLDTLLPQISRAKLVKHHPALPYRELAAFMQALHGCAGMAARGLEFLILNCNRSSEVRGATWEEIDFAKRIWTIPAERMKAKKEHRIPLSDTSMRLLHELPRFDDSALVFPSTRRKGEMSDMTLIEVLRRMGRNDITVHGFRSTFRDWAAEVTTYPSEMAEIALAHRVGSKVELAYRRGDMIEKRRQMMDEWASFCTTLCDSGL
ncbi:tyrosine-type recombinase/integrase [Niveibacterium sp.]|uniref:tyrosine-type recombinase/integrase n=1 Tax=Niveibacterium sp. TaxID=2017444 RepID=UPI0035B139BC